jgi:hypothetical protein
VRPWCDPRSPSVELHGCRRPRRVVEDAKNPRLRRHGFTSSRPIGGAVAMAPLTVPRDRHPCYGVP